mmetsp:Transcript_12461/g.18713  ORF Transcript_12461/g.18713 Transcript_12461/m.18713 type:complete len:295 (+) Transcript_12461:127-1011(+)
MVVVLALFRLLVLLVLLFLVLALVLAFLSAAAAQIFASTRTRPLHRFFPALTFGHPTGERRPSASARRHHITATHDASHFTAEPRSTFFSLFRQQIVFLAGFAEAIDAHVPLSPAFGTNRVEDGVQFDGFFSLRLRPIVPPQFIDHFARFLEVFSRVLVHSFHAQPHLRFAEGFALDDFVDLDVNAVVHCHNVVHFFHPVVDHLANVNHSCFLEPWQVNDAPVVPEFPDDAFVNGVDRREVVRAVPSRSISAPFSCDISPGSLHRGNGIFPCCLALRNLSVPLKRKRAAATSAP